MKSTYLVLQISLKWNSLGKSTSLWAQLFNEDDSFTEYDLRMMVAIAILFRSCLKTEILLLPVFIATILEFWLLTCKRWLIWNLSPIRWLVHHGHFVSTSWTTCMSFVLHGHFLFGGSYLKFLISGFTDWSWCCCFQNAWPQNGGLAIGLCFYHF